MDEPILESRKWFLKLQHQNPKLRQSPAIGTAGNKSGDSESKIISNPLYDCYAFISFRPFNREKSSSLSTVTTLC